MKYAVYSLLGFIGFVYAKDLSEAHQLAVKKYGFAVHMVQLYPLNRE